MKIESLWKFTFDPAGAKRVLLNYRSNIGQYNETRGDFIEGEIRWPLQRDLEVIPLVDAAAPFLRLSGNAQVTISYNVYSAPADALDVTARCNVLDSLIAITATGKKPLNIQISGYTAHYWQFAACVIADHDPWRDMESATARIVKSYQLICTGLSKIAGVPA